MATKTVQYIQQVGKLFSGDRIGLVTRTELTIMGCIKALGSEASTTNLVHAMTIIQGRQVSYGQVQTPVKALGDMGLIDLGQDGRSMVYTLSQYGETVFTHSLEIAKTLVEASKHVSPVVTKLTREPSELAKLALEITQGTPEEAGPDEEAEEESPFMTAAEAEERATVIRKAATAPRALPASASNNSTKKGPAAKKGRARRGR